MSRLEVLLGNMPRSSRLIGIWPQLRGCALFEIPSLIPYSKLKPTEWLLSSVAECLKDVTENSKTTMGDQNIWKGKLIARMSEYGPEDGLEETVHST